MTSPTSCRVSSSFLAPLLLVGALLMVAACRGDEKPASPNAEPSPAPTTEVTEPGPGRISVSAPQPLTLVPLSKTPEVWPIGRNIWGILVYDSATGEVTVAAEAGGGALSSSWLSETELLVRVDNSVAIYDIPSRSYRALDLGFDLAPNSVAVSSPDGSLVAIGGGGRDLVIADVRAMTYRVMSIQVHLQAWSPDSARLLVRGSEGVHSVIDIATLRQIVLPEVGFYTGWLNDSRVLGIGRGGALVVDVLTPNNPQVLPAVLDGVPGGNFSPGGRLFIGSAIHQDPTDPRTRTYTTALYRLDTFEQLAEFGNIRVCCGQTSRIWTSDSGHFVALRNACKEGESLVMVSVQDGSVTELAQAGTSQAAVSPDDRWVAFAHTQEGGLLSIVPADGSAPPLSISQRPYRSPAANLQWSPQGRFLAFSLGFYDRCN